MTAALSLVVILALSMVVTKVATVALVHTGMSREAARFQARSALTGVGLSTSVVHHPVRRRIVMWLMLLGKVGVVAAISSLVLSFAGEHTTSLPGRLASIALGVVVLASLARSPTVDRALSRAIGVALERWTQIDTRDYASLLHLAADYSVNELEVEEGDWLVDRPLGELRLSDEGVVVLGIQRINGAWVGTPRRETCVRAGDVLVLYGRERAIAQLHRRRDSSWGDREHAAAVQEIARVRAHEEERDRVLEQAARQAGSAAALERSRDATAPR